MKNVLVPTAVVVGVALTVPLAPAVAHPAAASAAKTTVNLSLTPTTAMVGTSVTFRSSGAPVARVAGRTAHLQVDSGSGWRDVRRTRYTTAGLAQATFTSTGKGTRRYRVIVRSSSAGRLLAKSATETVTWQKVTWTPRLSIAKSAARVGEDVPYTITVQPAELAPGRRVRVQVKGRVTWQTIDSFTLNSKGMVTDDVTGYAPGLGRYRVQVLSSGGSPVATSPIATVAWS